jgi:hypothetical protein
MSEGGLDECPPGVDQVMLLEPLMDEDTWLDGALITVPKNSATPVQYFDPAAVRTFVEQPVSGEGIWLGITPEKESYMYIPGSTHSIATRRLEGSVVYGEGWVQSWVNMGRKPLQYVELCMERFDSYDNHKVIRELIENEPVEAPMFWELWRLLRGESLAHEVDSK